MKVDFQETETISDSDHHDETVDGKDSDPDFKLSDSESDCSDEENEPLVCSTPEKEKKFIVFESAFAKLLDTCKKCGKSCTSNIVRKMGTLLLSNPNVSAATFTALGKSYLAGAILFSGSSPSKVTTMMSHANIKCFSVRTYYNIQAAYLIPTVISVWKTSQDEMIAEHQGTELTIGGDARCDSPGYSAKYGSYTFLDVKSNKVIDLQLVQVIVCISRCVTKKVLHRIKDGYIQ